MPGKYAPTITHHFIKYLHDKKILLRCYTQNIDGLHRDEAKEKNIIELHGSIFKAKCLNCGAKYDTLEYFDNLELDTDCLCSECREGFVKVSTISFGQALVSKTLQKAEKSCISNTISNPDSQGYFS